MTAVVGVGPLQRLDGPPPVPPLYGLVQAAKSPLVRIIDEPTDRWMVGAELYPYPPDFPGVYDSCSPYGSTPQTKAYGAALDHPQFGTITAYLPETCTSYRVWDQEQFKARAVLALSAVDGAAVEKEFMTGGQMALNPHLADGVGDFPNLDAAAGVVKGFAILENYLASKGRRGIIHCSPAMLDTAHSQRLLCEMNGYWTTAMGTVVVPGVGYGSANVDGTHPLTHPATSGQQEWVYATGPVDIRRSEVFTNPENVSEALDRGVGATDGKPNAITYRAERYYLVTWDTEVHGAVLVDRCTANC